MIDERFIGRRKSPMEVRMQLERTRQTLENFDEQIIYEYQLGKYTPCETPDKYGREYRAFRCSYETDIGEELRTILYKAIEAIDKEIVYIKDLEAVA